jgi:glycosyltransferase involved in cell wall biosynthesis
MITVVIPSYNRAHLLSQTIQSYLQPGVTKIILVDDASTDDTSLVMSKLCEEIENLEYIRLEKNSKQVYAKNRGIDKAETEWIYFGDDDSILIPGSITYLMDTCKTYQADICGAKALYMQSEEDAADLEKFLNKTNVLLPKGEKIADIRNVKANFHYSVEEPLEVPFTHAGALVKTSLAKKIRYDENYIGNCYREETDFFVRANIAGAKIMYNSNAVQVNLPRKMAKGGAHSAGKLRWYYYTIINNHYFMKKNWPAICKKYNIKTPAILIETKFVFNLMKSAVKNIIAWL